MYRTLSLTILVILLLTGAVVAANGSASGDLLYSQGQYTAAVAQYQQELARTPRSARLHTNLACALYQLGRSAEAINELKSALQWEQDNARAARINYDLGNCYFTTNQRQEAIAAYKAALRLNPADNLAKYNLEIALKQSPPPPPKNQSSQSPNQNNNSGDNQNDQQQQQNQPQQNNQRNAANQPSQMSRDEAERILDAMRQSERGPTHQNSQPRSLLNANKRDW